MRKIIFLISFLASIIGFAQDGSLDMSFNVQEPISPETLLKVQPDGKIILVERFNGSDGSVVSTKISRLYPDGSLDQTFFQGVGITIMPKVTSLAMQSDGKILIAGNFSKIENTIVGNLARLNQDGSIDESFAKVVLTGIETIAVQPDDKILIGGNFEKGVARLYSNGFLDPFFNSPITIKNENEGESVSNIVLLPPDNKVLAVGHVFINDEERRIFYLNSDGGLDVSFNEPSNIDWTQGDSYSPKFLAREKSDYILIGWPFNVFTNPEEIVGFNFIRLDPQGTITNMFHPVPFTNNCVFGVFPSALQDDGKIIMTGNDCIDYYGTEFRGILRLNNDGSLDESFNPGNGTNGLITNVAIQPDGKIIIVGYFNEYDGVQVPNIIRLTGETLSIGEFGSTGLNTYPNPVADYLYLQYPEGMSDVDIDELEIYDVTMKKIDFDGLNKDVIDVSGFSDGVYLLKIKAFESVYTSKFVKH
ncbi:MAG TPA: T9SS type A sorting domain-containing protein [Flavobacterium sp.]|uniref:T9SS type A sorting domain-containing protein n=1 Tax=Flavobacterium sp. TaxID=239 RepID=UPI002CE6C8D5|nr:T9SS type A sorting domain-containing protein [Flavobacterium sp.]HSD13101.1 T9SS type A sorting domain-containing protein [Flavobacterium sp.]